MSDSLLPDALTARLLAAVALLPDQARNVLLVVVEGLPRAVETGYGSIIVEFRDHAATVRVETSYKVTK